MVRLALESCTAQGFEGFEPSGKLGMIWRWANSDGCRTRIASPGCARRQQCVGCLAIRGADRGAGAAAKKTASGTCGQWQRSFYDRRRRLVRDLSCGDARIYLDVEVRRVACRSCGTVKRERPERLADNPFYNKRFAFFVGRRCRVATI